MRKDVSVVPSEALYRVPFDLYDITEGKGLNGRI